MIGNLMDWIRKKLDPPHYADRLEQADRTTIEKFMEVARYKHDLEILTGQRVDWPFIERRKVPRDK